MRRRTVEVLLLSIVVSLGAHGADGGASTQTTRRLFTVSDDIGFVHFAGTFDRESDAIHFSPDGLYFAVDTERGRLDLNCVEDSLRFYRSADVAKLLENPIGPPPPSPLWVVTSCSAHQGPSISHWRWLADSTGVAFLERAASGNEVLVIADLRKKKSESLTPATEMVEAFDIRDRQHYVYAVRDSGEHEKLRVERQSPVTVGSDHQLSQLLFPGDWQTPDRTPLPGRIWGVIGRKRIELKRNGVPLAFRSDDLALSPDGRYLVTTLPVSDIPVAWETLYAPPVAFPQFRIRAEGQGTQGNRYAVHQYVLIDLQTGSSRSLADAPISRDVGWWVRSSPRWSSDGREILLPGTFLSSKDSASSRPCIAVVDVPSNIGSCVELLKSHTMTGVEEGFHLVINADFPNGNKDQVRVTFINHWDQSVQSTEYRRRADGIWETASRSEGEPESGRGSFEVRVKQGLNDPPVLVAATKETSRVIWDPNPQFQDLELGKASVYQWQDKEGREWTGGLYQPSNYKREQRYPLVIQTHGFSESYFAPAGHFPTAFAARALAAAGVIVLQVPDDDGCPVGTLGEGACAVSDYEAAANQLVADGIVDPERIGIIGFSRTCYYVMETLTTSALHIKAASVTDGVMEGYLQYMIWGEPENGIAADSESVIGVKPFGKDLPLWLERSPLFRLDKVHAPVLVVGEGAFSLLGMWELYSGLRFLHKPVDLEMLNTDEHVLSNPKVRMASQGGSVDWFRFWLQDFEDSDPAKASQYERWRTLRQMQEENQKSLGTR